MGRIDGVVFPNPEATFVKEVYVMYGDKHILAHIRLTVFGYIS